MMKKEKENDIYIFKSTINLEPPIVL
jgi:hypothetical protein